MEDAIGGMDRRARLGRMGLDVDRALRTAGIEAGVSPRRRSRDQQLQSGEGEEAQAGDRRTAIHRPLWYTIQQ